MPGIAESDWKTFRELQELALERFCERALDEIVRLRADAQKTQHERYLAIYRLIQQRDQQLARTFDSPRRSAAMPQLASLRQFALITDEEFARPQLPMRAARSNRFCNSGANDAQVGCGFKPLRRWSRSGSPRLSRGATRAATASTP